MKRKRGIISGLIVFGLILAVFLWFKFSDTNFNRYNAEFMDVFDTVTQLTGYAKDKETFSGYAQWIHDDLKEYHQLYDIYRTYEGMNNMKTINDNAGIVPVKVDQRIIDMLIYGKELYEKTNGKINIAFGSVLSIWHEYRSAGIEDPKSAKLPDALKLREANEHTKINDIIIDLENNTVFLKDPQMSLDVGALAKGYAVEQVCEAAASQGIDHMLVSAGGNVKAIGSKINEEEWIAGIQNPDRESADPYLYKAGLINQSLVTSGNYQRYYTVDGKRYHHIINPDTLMPEDFFIAVSILCEDSGFADALSTAVYNMPFEEGLQFIESLKGVEAMWVFADKSIRFSSGFEAYIRES